MAVLNSFRHKPISSQQKFLSDFIHLKLINLRSYYAIKTCPSNFFFILELLIIGKFTKIGLK